MKWRDLINYELDVIKDFFFDKKMVYILIQRWFNIYESL